MTLDLYVPFVLATAILMLIPGPNVALIAATSLAHGVRYGLTTVAGTASAMVVQLAIVGAGLSTLLLKASEWFDTLRWLGVAYLIILGITMWRAKAPKQESSEPKASSHRTSFLHGLLVSLTNPKTLLFYGAFFPQFMAPESNAAPQILILSLTFIAVAIAIDSAWAFAAGRMRAWNIVRRKWNNRLAGGLLIGAGLGLALTRRT